MESLRDFIKFRVKYDKRARERMPERIDAGLAGDSTFEFWVVEEMLMDAFTRIEAQEHEIKALKDLLNPE